MDCQVEAAPAALQPLAFGERWGLRLLRRAGKLVAGLERRARAVFGRAGQRPAAAPARQLGLREGERVRVRSLEEIRATLDPTGRFDGLGYMPAMNRFCGRVFAVHKRVRHFFDEPSRRLLKVRDVVLLEGVYCEPSLASGVDYACCERSCFLFWKEAWLERVP